MRGSVARWRQRAALLLVGALLALPSCGGEQSGGGTGGGAPACPPPELELPDGSCIRPGVPPDGCGPGFEHDGEYGCEPILPAEDCPPGLMAVPGDTECRPVMPCAEGKWGDIPGDATTQYVDGSYSGGSSTGSMQQPRTTIQDAVDAAQPGAIIAIAAGSYLEEVVIAGKAVRLWGVCPEKVEVVGTGIGPAAIIVLDQAGGAEVRGLAVTGPRSGLGLSGSKDVTFDRLWVHGTGTRGIEANNLQGPTSLSLTGVLVEDNHDVGLFIDGSQATVHGSVVRRTAPRQSDQTAGRGIDILACRPSEGCNQVVPSVATLTGVLVEDSHEMGLFVAGSQATVQSSVIRRTAPQQSDQTAGRGVGIQACATADGCNPVVPSVATLTGVLVEDSHAAGLFIDGSQATVQGSVVRRTAPQQSNQTGGRGIGIQACGKDIDCTPVMPSVATLTNVLVEDSHDVGLFIDSSQATMQGSVVRRTTPRQSDQAFGRGINIQACGPAHSCNPVVPSVATLTGVLVEDSYELGLFIGGSQATVQGSVVRRTAPRQSDQALGRGIDIQACGTAHGCDPVVPADTTLTGVLVEDSHELGLFLSGSQATVQGSVVRRTAPQGSNQTAGRGINIQACVTAHGCDPVVPADATLMGVLVEDSHDVGLYIEGSQATVDGSIVRRTLARASDGWFGDGVSVFSESGPAEVTITGTLIDDSARAVLSNFGGHVAIGASRLRCGSFAMEGEEYNGQPFGFDDLGDVLCGCPEADAPCVAVSAGLPPPEPVESLP